MLRNLKGLANFELSATDDEVGHVSGFPLDDETWPIRFLVTDASNGWVGHDVPVAPPWIQGVQWSDQAVSIDLRREAIRSSAPHDANSGRGRDQEVGLYRPDGRSGYFARGHSSGLDV